MKARNTGNEIYAVLVGHTPHRHVVQIETFSYPVMVSSTPSGCWCSEKSWQAIRDATKLQGLQIVGAIHSHPNWPPVMSPLDYKSHRVSADKITGIVEATNRRTRVFFWHDSSPLPCTLEYI